LVPSPQPYCCNCVPEVVDALGTSTHRVLLPLTRLNCAFGRATAFHCWLVPPPHATWMSGAELSAETPVTSTHLPLEADASV
jgi:hypothetical protein